jgi:hypothetical protein
MPRGRSGLSLVNRWGFGFGTDDRSGDEPGDMTKYSAILVAVYAIVLTRKLTFVVFPPLESRCVPAVWLAWCLLKIFP